MKAWEAFDWFTAGDLSLSLSFQSFPYIGIVPVGQHWAASSSHALTGFLLNWYQLPIFLEEAELSHLLLNPSYFRQDFLT